MTDSGEQICRLCLSSKGVILPMFNGIVAEQFSIPLPVKIMSCLSIEVSSDDILPTLICYRCLYEIDRFHEFKEACVKVDTILQECATTSDSNIIVTEMLDIKEEIFNAMECGTATDDALVHASRVSISRRDVEETIGAINEGGIPEMNDHSSAESLEVLASKRDESVVPCGIRNARDTSFPENGILAFVTATETNTNPSLYEEIIYRTVTDENAESTYHLALEDEELPGAISSPSNGLISSVVGNEGATSSPSKEMVSLTVVTEGTSSSQSNKKSHAVENEETTNTSRNNTISCEVVNEENTFCFKPFDSDTFKKLEKMNGNKSETIKDKGKKRFSCKYCPGKYNTQKYLRYHEQFNCRLLSKETKEKNKTERLEKRAAGLIVPRTPIQLPVCCRFCSISFMAKKRWWRHQKYWCPLNPNREPRRRNRFCKICNETFQNSEAWLQHNQLNIGTHGLHCRFCSKIYFSKMNLGKHESVHMGRKPFNCRVCEKAFTDRSNCLAHEKIHKNEKPFLCSICGKAFMFRKVLRSHEFLHTGIRPVKCELCPKTFADKSNLLSHQRHVHSTVRKHRCSYCERTFMQNSKLQKHIRVHFGERPYRIPKHKRKQPENVKESDPSTKKD